MNNTIIFGFEILTVGFLVVIVTLLVLAFILMIFNKVFTVRGKKQPKTVFNTAEKPVSAAGVNLEAGAESACATKGSGQDLIPKRVAASMGVLLYSFKKDFSTYHIKSVDRNRSRTWGDNQREQDYQT